MGTLLPRPEECEPYWSAMDMALPFCSVRAAAQSVGKESGKVGS